MPTGDERRSENSFVLDSSALLTVILREPGATTVESAIVSGAAISTVNFAEVVSRLMEIGLTEVEAYVSASEPDVALLPFGEAEARVCGFLRPRTRHLGLGLGDRACLAVGRSLGLPVLTADRVWAQLDVGVEVVVCR